MDFSPHDYQELVIDHLLRPIRGHGVFLDMGLGKTSCALTALIELVYNRLEIDKTLIIAPKRVAIDTWPEEIEKWDHTRDLSYSMVIGSAKQRREALSKQARIYITNRENVRWLVEELEQSWWFDLLIIDELSSFKNHTSERFKALRRVRPLSKKVIGLTGTPAPNGYLNLWSQLYLIDQGERLGKTFGGYRRTYFQIYHILANGTRLYELQPGAKDKIDKLIGDVCISMKAEDHIKMPERIDNYIPVTLNPKARRQYNELRDELVVEIEDAMTTDAIEAAAKEGRELPLGYRVPISEISADNATVLSGKLLQMASGAVYDEDKQVVHIHDCKLDKLEEIVEEMQGKPMIVFYWYIHEKDRILARIKGARVYETSQDKADWNEGKIPVMLLQPASAGHGLNLQEGGNTATWFTMTWDLELYQQANARILRQGQPEDTVVINHLIAKDTWDLRVKGAIAHKTLGQDSLLGALRADLQKSGSTSTI